MTDTGHRYLRHAHDLKLGDIRKKFDGKTLGAAAGSMDSWGLPLKFPEMGVPPIAGWLMMVNTW